MLFRDVVLPSGAAAAVCLSVLGAASLSAEDEASVPCNSFEYWSGQKSINTVSQATMQATQKNKTKTNPACSDSKMILAFFFAHFRRNNARLLVRFSCIGFVLSTSDWHRETLFLSLPDASWPVLDRGFLSIYGAVQPQRTQTNDLHLIVKWAPRCETPGHHVGPPTFMQASAFPAPAY